MTSVVAYRFDVSPHSREGRTELRRLLRRAVRGDADAFVLLAAPYCDLITEFVALCGIDDEEPLRAKTREVHHEIWKYLPFMHRVSDFERLLATTLFSVRPRESSTVGEACPGELQNLDPREKFALLARDFEGWDYGWTATALRVSRRELGEILVSVRCRLLGIDLDALDKESASCIRKLSLDLDGRNVARETQKICRNLARLPKAKAFKSEWLNLRCELIELRQQIRLPEETKQTILEALVPELRSEAMIRVPLLERFTSRLSFRQSSVTAL